jgi:uncharacterized membrane protein YeaQ/YmgE (transglycosylase-associated protein family)
MEYTSLFVILALGAIAGWLAGLIMKGNGFGIFLNIIIGIIGAVIGGWVFDLLGITTSGPIGAMISAIIGAVILLIIIGFFKKN